MSKGTPAERRNEQVATALAGTEAAAGVGGTTDNGGGLDVGLDEYGEILAAINRSEEQDQRIAAHEVGHLLALRLQDWPADVVTI